MSSTINAVPAGFSICFEAMPSNKKPFMMYYQLGFVNSDVTWSTEVQHGEFHWVRSCNDRAEPGWWCEGEHGYAGFYPEQGVLVKHADLKTSYGDQIIRRLTPDGFNPDERTNTQLAWEFLNALCNSSWADDLALYSSHVQKDLNVDAKRMKSLFNLPAIVAWLRPTRYRILHYKNQPLEVTTESQPSHKHTEKSKKEKHAKPDAKPIAKPDAKPAEVKSVEKPDDEDSSSSSDDEEKEVKTIPIKPNTETKPKEKAKKGTKESNKEAEKDESESSSSDDEEEKDVKEETKKTQDDDELSESSSDEDENKQTKKEVKKEKAKKEKTKDKAKDKAKEKTKDKAPKEDSSSSSDDEEDDKDKKPTKKESDSSDSDENSEKPEKVEPVKAESTKADKTTVQALKMLRRKLRKRNVDTTGWVFDVSTNDKMISVMGAGIEKHTKVLKKLHGNWNPEVKTTQGHGAWTFQKNGLVKKEKKCKK